MDIIVIILIIISGIVIINYFKQDLNGTILQNLKYLWFYHLLFGTYFCFFVFGDAVGYWIVPKEMSYESFILGLTTEKGTYFMFSLNYFPSKVLGLSYLTGTLLYSLIGFVGLLFFYITALKIIPMNSTFKGYTLFPLLFFLPNLHFWSCGVGKDTLLFFAIGAFVYGLLQPSKRIILLVLALLLSYLIRPHITLFMVVAFGLAYMMSSKVSVIKRFFFMTILLGIGVAILPTVLEFAKIEEATVESFDNFSDKKSSVLSRGNTGSRIDISSYPFPVKVFTFLFRPLFFDINGIPALLASFENLLLLVLSYRVFRYKPWETFKNSPYLIKGLMLFLVIGTLAFSQSLGNLGIMIRMRNMFLPGLLIYILWAFSYRQELEIRQDE